MAAVLAVAAVVVVVATVDVAVAVVGAPNTTEAPPVLNNVAPPNTDPPKTITVCTASCLNTMCKSSIIFNFNFLCISYIPGAVVELVLVNLLLALKLKHDAGAVVTVAAAAAVAASVPVKNCIHYCIEV